MLKYDYLPEFLFLRHGETDWNRESRIQGLKDIPLNKTGIEQSQQAADGLKDIAISTIITSPLKRAYQTAEIVNELHGVPVIVERDIQEANFGAEQGNIRQGWAEDWRSGEFMPEGAESYRGFSNRVMTGLTCALLEDCKQVGRELDENVAQGRNQNRIRGAIPLVVAHGGVYWSIVQSLDLSSDLNIANGLPVHIYQEGSRWQVTPLMAWRQAIGGMM